MIQELKDLMDRHSAVASYQSIGKTFLGNDLWVFRIGKSTAKILLDATIHGHEMPSSHTLYFLANWLLESGDSDAQNVLNRLQVLLVPLLNYDNARFGGPRKNANGVDLNRNFARGWCAGSSDPNNDYYKGPSPASEVETQVLRAILMSELPKAHLNIHDWGGNPPTAGDFRFPSYGGSAYTAECTTLHNAYVTLIQQKGFTPHKLNFGGAYGGARDDGFDISKAAAACWEETSTYTTPSENVTEALIRYNKTIHLESFVIAAAQKYGVPVSQNKYVFKQWQDGDPSPIKTIIV